MSWGPREHCQGTEAEPCSRALSQARVYLEQIRSRVAVSISEAHKWDYLLDAAKQIRLALERDVSEDYEEAFNFYKNGVDLLLSGIQGDSNTERREAVKHKITQYLKRAEEIFNCHLQRTLGNGPAAVDGYSSLRFRPIRSLCCAVENLKACKVLRIIDKVQLVQDPRTGATFILKSLPKSQLDRREQQTIIAQGVPFMVTLLRYYTSEDAIFLQLEHVEGDKLWTQLQKRISSSGERGKKYPECSRKNSSSTPLLGLRCTPSDCRGRCGSVGIQSHSLSQLTSKKHTQSGSCRNHSSQPSQEFSPHLSTLSCGVPGCEDPYNFHTASMDAMTDVKQAQGTVSSSSTTSVLLSQSKYAEEHGHATNESNHLKSNSFQTDGRSFSNLNPGVPPLPSESLVRGVFSLEEGGGYGIPSAPNTMPGGREILDNITGKLPHTLTQTPLDPEETSGRTVGYCHIPSLAHAVPSTPAPGPSTRQADIRHAGPSHLMKAGGDCVAGKITECQDEDSPAVQLLGDAKKMASVHGQDAQPTGRHNKEDDCDLMSPVDPKKKAQGAWGLPEEQIQQWAAEIVLALEGLHQQGVICYDLNPRNILLDTKGHIRLTYFGQWTEVEPQCYSGALEDLYAAPEIFGMSKVTQACDWWSLGALLYELLTGMSLSQNHRSGIHPHTGLLLPDTLSRAAASFVSELLQFDPDRRLGSGIDGISKIKAHPFFRTIQWNKLL
ncbi:ribosomal protein S6 kinase-like 1 [Rhinatrema bivittatum]|uniref:ribosomal protein S6 kinase-like 1 n=1 Tax=Rhinatrema bivittatum TaxID=194408 RepID=UPI00112A2B58|nr:ribosomal protein S6 kinase-like 1 [Rhinatrema bivittatum]